MSKQFSAKEQTLIAEANAKAKARDPAAFAANLPKDTRPSKGGAKAIEAKIRAEVAKVTQVPAAAAEGATEKAPHTKRAVQQGKDATKITNAEAKVTELRATVAALTTVANKTKRDTPERLAAFKAKAEAETALVAAVKAVATLKHEATPPAERKQPTAKAARQPRTTEAKTYKVLNKDHGAKPDSKRAKQLTIVFAHKDTATAKAAGAESVDFAFAVLKGFIAYTS